MIPILIAPNMSRAVNLLMRLVREAARTLAQEADIAIIERHHRTKKDAPSGTASNWPISPSRALLPLTAGSGNPTISEISMHLLRLADSPGEHTVVFAVPGETIELGHRALNRGRIRPGLARRGPFPRRETPRAFTRSTMFSGADKVAIRVEYHLRSIPASITNSSGPKNCLL